MLKHLKDKLKNPEDAEASKLEDILP